MKTSIFLIFIIPPLLGVVTGAIAQKKGQPFFGWWAFGTLLFIVALPLALWMDDQPAPGMTRCAYCAKQIKLGSAECPKCRRAQPNVNAATLSSWQRVLSAPDEVAQWKQKGEAK